MIAPGLAEHDTKLWLERHRTGFSPDESLPRSADTCCSYVIVLQRYHALPFTSAMAVK